MKDKDAAIIKVLSDIKYLKEPLLTQEQEAMLKRATDPEEQFLYDVKRIFGESDWSVEDGVRDAPNPLPMADAKSLNSVFNNSEYIYNRAIELGNGDMDRGMKKMGKVQAIPVAKIVGTEEMIDGEHLNALIQGKRTTDSVPLTIKMGDKYYIMDGNHRAAAALNRGDKTTPAFVFDLSKI